MIWHLKRKKHTFYNDLLHRNLHNLVVFLTNLQTKEHLNKFVRNQSCVMSNEDNNDWDLCDGFKKGRRCQWLSICLVGLWNVNKDVFLELINHELVFVDWKWQWELLYQRTMTHFATWNVITLINWHQNFNC